MLQACQEHNYSTIAVKGKIKNCSSNKASLISFGSANNPIVLDTCTIDKNGNYSLKSLSNTQELYALKIEGLSEIWLVNDVNEVEINADVSSFKNYEVKNSFATQKLHKFIATLDSVVAERTKTDCLMDSLRISKNDSLLTIQLTHSKALKQYTEQYVNSNIVSDNPALLCFYLYYISKTEILENFDVRQRIEKAVKQFPNHSQLHWLQTGFSDFAKNNPDKFIVGDSAIDFKYLSIDSQNVSLKNYTGKYLLINFWQAKSTDCIKENDRIKNLYNKYKDKNLDVLSISLDSSATLWNKAVKKDSLPWMQVRDTLFFNSTIAKKYFVNSVPNSVIISPTKKIVAVNIKDDKLKLKLQDLFD